jgi:hypothetical protein
MITVSISINGEPLFTRTAVNTGKKKEVKRWGCSKMETIYKLDDGSEVLHARNSGAVRLAIKILKTIKEQ